MKVEDLYINYQSISKSVLFQRICIFLANSQLGKFQRTLFVLFRNKYRNPCIKFRDDLFEFRR